MLVLKIVSGLLVAGAVVAAVIACVAGFNAWCEERFGLVFLGVRGFAWVALGSAPAHGGLYWWEHARTTGGDVSNGIVLVVLAGVVAVGMLVNNVRHAGVVFGAGGTALQIGVFGYLAYVLFFPALVIGGIALAVSVLSCFDTDYVYVRRSPWW